MVLVASGQGLPGCGRVNAAALICTIVDRKAGGEKNYSQPDYGKGADGRLGLL